MRRSVMELVGPFDNYLGVGTDYPSCEDVDFGLRAEELGVAMWTTPRSIVYHSYGRRYGLRNVLKHHKGYAMGSGALSAKLLLWNHRLSKIWVPVRPLTRVLNDVFRNPPRGLLGLYKSKYAEQAYQTYLSQFELGPNRLYQPRRFEGNEHRRDLT